MYDGYIYMSYAATFVPLGILGVISFRQWRAARVALNSDESSDAL